MTMIVCSECGRAISDRASACVGCGAPLGSLMGIELAPAAAPGPAPSRRQLRKRLLLSSLMLLAGVFGASLAPRLPRFGQLARGAATLLILLGLIWLLVSLVQRLAPRD